MMAVTLKSPITPSTKTTLLEHVECDNNMWRHLANIGTTPSKAIYCRTQSRLPAIFIHVMIVIAIVIVVMTEITDDDDIDLH